MAGAETTARLPVVRLAEIATKIGSGATPRGGKESYRAEGISLIRSMNVHDFRFEYSGLAHIDGDQARALDNVTVEQDDVLLNITGASVARCCMTPRGILPARVNQHVAIIRVKKTEADPCYVHYCLVSPQYKDHLLSIAQGGATREALTKEKIEEFRIPCPPLATQRKIAAILSAYDDLIENNLRRIKILEEMAQNLYREWFVKFRFPGHEHARFVDSPLGRIPEGWEAVKVGSLLSRVRRPARVQKRHYAIEGPIPVVDQGRDFVGGYTDRDEALIEDGLPLIVFGDHTRVLKYIDFPFACGADGTQLLKSDNVRMPMTLFYHALVSIDLSDFAYARHFKLLKEELLALPAASIAMLYDRFALSLRNQVSSLMERNDSLRATRDLLLPRLISGELDVSELGIAASEAAAGV